MSVSLFDSEIYRTFFTHSGVARLFTDSAEVRAMLLVEGVLARAQGGLGIIPGDSAAAIHRASMELQLDPAGLAAATGTNGVPVPGLVTAFRKAMQAPDHAQYVHWGATSQDIADTALMLRLRQALGLIESDMARLLRALAALAEAHAETPMAGRTYGQLATPTSFGAVAAGWGGPVLRQFDRLQEMRPRLLCVSLSGAAGTGAALGPRAAETRAALAAGLGLFDPRGSWHSARDRVAELAGWLTLLAAATGKMGADLVLMSQTALAEVRLPGSGGSSTMPQKQNPVAPSALQALAAHVGALNTAVQGAAATHTLQRDGAAWFTEWLALPQMVVAAARSVEAAADLAEGLEPHRRRMAENLDDGRGLIHAEALSFALAGLMPRPEAQSRIKALCGEVNAKGGNLLKLVERDFPELDLSRDPDGIGQAPAEARAFAALVRDRVPPAPGAGAAAPA